MVDQKWNKNALGYGEKDKAISQDQWNKNALNYDPNEKIDIDIKNKLGEENYEDDKINVKLHYYICSHISGDIYLNEHEDSVWVSKNEFKNYNFVQKMNLL